MKTTEVRRLWLWLLLILGLGLGLRLAKLSAPLQQDEYGPLYAVVERSAQPGFLPAAADPLLPVASGQEVRTRSVLPYGVTQSTPLYHWLLHGVVQVLPASVWWLRFPALVAGLCTVSAVYLLGRRLGGVEAGLWSALLIAVEPMSVTIGALARPYAIGCLACVLSSLALLSILSAVRWTTAAAAALGYGLSIALAGYMHPTFLAIGVVHALWCLTLREGRPVMRAWVALAAGVAIAALLLAPQVDYLRAVRQFSQERKDYFIQFGLPDLTAVWLHNAPILIGLGVVAVARFFGRASGTPDRTDQPAAPRLVRLAWFAAWLFLVPQVAAMGMYLFTNQSVFLSRYLLATALGGVMLVVALALQNGPTALGRMGLLALTGLYGFWGWQRPDVGHELVSLSYATLVMKHVDKLDERGLWKEGDLLLVRSGFFEADWLPDGIDQKNRFQVERAIVTPLLTLSPPRHAKPYQVLSLSFRSGTVRTRLAGPAYQPARLYNESFAAQLQRYQRFWLINQHADSSEFLAGFLAWLAQAFSTDLQVSVVLPEFPEPLTVRAGVTAEELLRRWQAMPDTDFLALVLIERKAAQGEDRP